MKKLRSKHHKTNKKTLIFIERRIFIDQKLNKKLRRNVNGFLDDRIMYQRNNKELFRHKFKILFNNNNQIKDSLKSKKSYY